MVSWCLPRSQLHLSHWWFPEAQTLITYQLFTWGNGERKKTLQNGSFVRHKLGERAEPFSDISDKRELKCYKTNLVIGEWRESKVLGFTRQSLSWLPPARAGLWTRSLLEFLLFLVDRDLETISRPPALSIFLSLKFVSLTLFSPWDFL